MVCHIVAVLGQTEEGQEAGSTTSRSLQLGSGGTE